MPNAFPPADGLLQRWFSHAFIPAVIIAFLTASFFTPPVFASASPATAAEPAAPDTAQPPSSEPGNPQPQAGQADLWQRLRDGLALKELDSPLVGTHARWFAQRPDYLQGAIERSRLYLFHIVEEVEKRKMPMEIALLPIIESSYNPQAQSPMKASGIWQFIPSTGKVFGLTQNGWYDGRRDVLTATRAALDYLGNLHRRFGSWELALAAYNCGEGCVGRAIQRNRAKGLPTDYLSLNLPGETRHYVPKLMAVRGAILAPDRFGLYLDDLPNQPFFKQVSLTHPMEAKTAARLAGMDMASFLALNPAFKRRVIHSDSQSTLLLPVDKAQTFLAKLDEAETRQIRMRLYQARKGELLTRIAEKFDVTIQWLKEHNPLDLNRGKLVQTQTILLPPSAPLAVATNRAKPSTPAPAQPSLAPVVTPEPTGANKPAPARTALTDPELETGPILRGHLVRRGDTLVNLAQRYKVSVTDIRGFNKAMKTLRPGDIVLIPVNS